MVSLHPSLTVGWTSGLKPSSGRLRAFALLGFEVVWERLQGLSTRVTKSKKAPGSYARFSEPYFLFGARWDM